MEKLTDITSDFSLRLLLMDTAAELLNLTSNSCREFDFSEIFLCQWTMEVAWPIIFLP